MSATDPDARRPRPSGEAITAATILAGGVVYAYLAVREGIGSASSSGAGFFPLLVAVVLVCSSATVLVQERRGTRSAAAEENGPDDDEGAPLAADEVHWKRVVAVLLSALAVPLLAGTVGFVVTLSAAVVLIAKIMGMAGILKPLALGIGFGLTAWLVFVYWLFVPLPAGVLGLA